MKWKKYALRLIIWGFSSLRPRVLFAIHLMNGFPSWYRKNAPACLPVCQSFVTFPKVADNLFANGFRHAKETVELKGSICEGTLYLYVKDDGAGFSGEAQKLAESFSIKSFIVVCFFSICHSSNEWISFMVSEKRSSKHMWRDAVSLCKGRRRRFFRGGTGKSHAPLFYYG